MNCGNEMKMKKWSSQWTQFMQLRKETWKKKFRTSTGPFSPLCTWCVPFCYFQCLSAIFLPLSRHFGFLWRLPLTTRSQTSVPRSPLPVPRFNNILLQFVGNTNKGQWKNPVEVLNFFFQVLFTQLHKLRSLRRSFLHFQKSINPAAIFALSL